MTTLLVAVLTCNGPGCEAQLILHGFVRTRNVDLAAREKGWRHGDRDLCPACIAGDRGQLPLEAAAVQ